MCGIAGEIDLKNSVELADYHEKMLLSMKRRGPDGHGIYRAQNAVLLHTRLAVIDVENGKQPMTATRGNQSFTICYNGELYNTAQLRVELIAAGMSFKTNSDTEVVLRRICTTGKAVCSTLTAFLPLLFTKATTAAYLLRVIKWA